MPGDVNPEVFIPAMVALHARDRFPFDRLITFDPFDQVNQAIADARRGLVVKPVLRMP